MAYRRGSYALTPPSVAIFTVSIILAIAAMLVRYADVAVPIFNSARIFEVLALAYILLMVGVLFRRV